MSARVPEKGTESTTVKLGTDSPANSEKMIEEAYETGNLKEALRCVKANTGAAGVDGLSVKELPDFTIGGLRDGNTELPFPY